MKGQAKCKRLALRLLGTTMLVAVGAAYAQHPVQAQNAGNGADSSGGVQEIVVTAQKRSENLQTVPISIEALTPEVLEQHQVQSFDDYAKLLPSASFQSLGPGVSQLFFRGIVSGRDGNPFGALPTAGVYLDETPVTTTGSLLDVHMYDIARVEALSGPQGTLFGASSEAGTLRIITNKPDPRKYEAGYDLDANKFGDGGPGGSVQAFVNIPITDHVAVRIVGFEEKDGGYIDNTLGSRTFQRPHTVNGSVVTSPLTVTNADVAQNDFNTANTYGGRIALGIELNDDWTITPQFVGQNQYTSGTFLYDPHAGFLKVHDYLDGSSNDKWYQAALTVKGKVFDWDLLYNGGYMDRHNVALQDYSYYTVAYDHFPDYTYFQNRSGADLSPNQFVERANDYTKATHEIRLSSPTGQRLQVTTGLFYERQTDDFTAHYIIPGVSQSPQAVGYYIPGTGNDDVFFSNAVIVDRDYAAFAQADFKILPDLTFTGGIRGFEYRNDVVGFSGGAGTVKKLKCGPAYSTNCISIDKSAHGSGETHKLSLSWQIDPDRMVYTTYSTGFRPGGINRPIGYAPYSPDTLDNYELGWKTTWLDRRLRFNGAVYHENWNGIQYSLPGANGVGSFVNAGDASVDGVETDVQARVGDLTLSVAGAYNYSRLTTPFCTMINGVPHCELSLQAPSGTRLPVQPALKIMPTARYSFDVGNVAAYGQVSMLHESSTTSLLTVSQSRALGSTPPFTTFDVALGGMLENGMNFEFYVQNLFDEQGELSRNSQCLLSTCLRNGRIYPVKPQLFGIKFGQRF